MRDPYSHSAVWRIALPMIISSITAPLLGLVDTAVMGHLTDASYLAAVAAGAAVFSVLFMGLNFLRMGTTGLTAQAYGAGANDELRTALGQPVITALLLAAIILAFQGPILAGARGLLSASDAVAEHVQTYFRIRIWSAPAALANFAMIGWLIGMQNARAPLLIMLTINGINITLDLVFVIGLGMTVDGVALATVIAEVAGICIAVLLVRRELRRWPGHWQTHELFNVRHYRRLFDVNVYLLIRTMALMFVFTFITAQGARMGDLILATNALLMNFQLFLSYALDGIAYAAEALVGKAVGGRDQRGVVLAVRRTLQWSLLFTLVFTLAYWLAGQLIIDTLTDIAELRSTAGQYLVWLVALPLISVWSFLYDGVFVGATRSREMMIVMVGSALLVFLPVWLTFNALGNHALWLAFSLFMLARGLGMHVWFRRMIRHDLLVPAPTESIDRDAR